MRKVEEDANETLKRLGFRVQILLEDLRELDGASEAEQEASALNYAIEFLRGLTPEIATEELDAPLLRLFSRTIDAEKGASMNGNTGNQTSFSEEFPLMQAVAAVLVLKEDHGETQKEACEKVAKVCPAGVTSRKLKNWSMLSRQLTPERERKRELSAAALRYDCKTPTAILARIEVAFTRMSAL
ncbi:hypothetical protein C1J03_22365 [Sulfitobacter sp. SK012]|uniref:hypothetical protein n=1 Tax=Sulfitobacter sp. SK012 TaxID=1389005 RepID=UPI000E0A28DA|nr:hypothetical protein [Sulfitobacter sp. SK012]AXI48497.1 hypothetical protein C1J03_22365 [Sulfitobacter sp. SK012]